MAISTAMCTSFKVELFQGVHNFLLSGGDTYKAALYSSAATLGASTTAYSATNEISGTNYTAAGNSLTRIDPTSSGTTAYVDFADLVFSNVTISGVRGCEIYNSTDSNKCVSTHDFGSDKAATAGDFTLVFPTADASNAILRLA
jgi:hypothetical protein